MSKNIESLEAEFKNRPLWLQDATARLLVNGALSDADIKDLVTRCKAEAGITAEGDPETIFESIPTGAFLVADGAQTLRLDSISDVIGINALAPKKPLLFENTSLTIVYGPNGSGKSGYVRVLKHICGSKGLPPLHGNVFKTESVPQSCKIGYTLNGMSKTADWTPRGGSIADLKGVAIYDMGTAQLYINAENEVSFEPRVLRLFRVLVETCSKVDQALRTEIATMVSGLPRLPLEHAETSAGKWYAALAHTTAKEAIEEHCKWTAEQDQNLVNLRARAAEKSPTEKALALRRTKGRTDQFLTGLQAIYNRLTDEAFDALQTARATAIKNRKAATEDVQKVFEGGLTGIGSETWRALWKAARAYSIGEAYKENPFPNVSEDARCVLCQQPIKADARARLEHFETFVKGELESAAATAEAALAKVLKDLESGIGTDALPAALDTAGIEDKALREESSVFHATLEVRRAKFASVTDKLALPQIPIDQVSAKIKHCSEALETKAKAFDEDAKTTKKGELLGTIAEDAGRKWVGEQKTAIEAEIKRLGAIHALEEACRKTNTKWLSETKAALSEDIITAGFATRFKNHLKGLRAGNIQVKIEKTRATKGQVFHQVLIKGAKSGTKPAEVLSEGQFRIVSIAAFLADVESYAENTPFLFDDPVCSLDHIYEGATATKLVDLSKKRQVVIFTHRLSMVSLLTDAAGKAGIEPSSISVRSESWGAGEPDPTLLAKQKPDKAIKALLQDRLKKAREVFQIQGRAEYDPIGKGICSEVRMIAEKSVEVYLLNDVVQRFRREVHTKGKLEKLSRIRESDCRILDEYMTKYSFFEHDQPPETPIEVPEPDEIKTDLESLLKWCEEFKLLLSS